MKKLGLIALIFISNFVQAQIANSNALTCELNLEIKVYKKKLGKYKFKNSYIKQLSLPESIFVKADHSDEFSLGWLTRGYSVNDRSLDINLKIEGSMDSADVIIRAQYSDDKIKTEQFEELKTVIPTEGFIVDLIQKLPEPESTYGKYRSEISKIIFSCRPQ